MKMLTKSILLSLIAIPSLTAASSAQAFQFFFGEDINTGAVGNSAPILTNTPNSAAAEAAFLTNLSGVGTEDFEGQTVGATAPLTLNFGTAGTATLNGSGDVFENSEFVSGGISAGGGFAISGEQAWVTGINGFSIDFTEDIAALGFFVNDLETGQLALNLTLANGGTQQVAFNNTVPLASGSVHYFGLIADNPGEAFTSASFSFIGGGSEGIVFDDLTIGTFEQVTTGVPEPASILSLTAIGFGAFLKRKKLTDDDNA